MSFKFNLNTETFQKAQDKLKSYTFYIVVGVAIVALGALGLGVMTAIVWILALILAIVFGGIPILIGAFILTFLLKATVEVGVVVMANLLTNSAALSYSNFVNDIGYIDLFLFIFTVAYVMEFFTNRLRFFSVNVNVENKLTDSL